MEQDARLVRNRIMGNDLRFALRMILSHRWFSAAVVATLAMGIGLNTMVFTLVNAVLLKPVGVQGGARLMAINYLNHTHGEQRYASQCPTSATTGRKLVPSKRSKVSPMRTRS